MSELVKWVHRSEWVGLDVNPEPTSTFAKLLVLISPTPWGLIPEETACATSLSGGAVSFSGGNPAFCLISVKLNPETGVSDIGNQQELSMFRLQKLERLQTHFPDRISIEKTLQQNVFQALEICTKYLTQEENP